MAIENGIVVSPISIGDVASALGEGSRDLGTLCSSTKVNPWATHKPVNNTKDLFTKDYTYKGEDGNCGFNIPKLTISSANLAQLIPYYSQENNGWTPQYNSNPPYRLEDFIGYKHDATPPIRAFGSSGNTEHDIEQDGDSISFQILTNSPTLGDGYNLRFDDFGKGETSSSENPISDWYIGYFIVDSLGNVVARRVGERNTIQPSIALGGWTATLDVSGLSLGNYTVYPFIADQTLTQDAADKTITVSPLPVVSPMALSIVEYGDFEWYATAERDSSLGSINITIYAHNKKQVAVILNNNKIDYYASPTAVKSEYAVKDITVNPNNAYVVIGRALISPSEYTNLAYVIVSLGGGRFVSDQIGVEEENEGGGGLLPTDESAE